MGLSKTKGKKKRSKNIRWFKKNSLRINKLKKIIEIDEERLEPFHIRELGRNEIIEAENKIKEPEIPWKIKNKISL